VTAARAQHESKQHNKSGRVGTGGGGKTKPTRYARAGNPKSTGATEWQGKIQRRLLPRRSKTRSGKLEILARQEIKQWEPCGPAALREPEKQVARLGLMEKTESATAKNAEELRVLTGGGKLAETRRETEEQI
jgi:hypothetical protein